MNQREAGKKSLHVTYRQTAERAPAGAPLRHDRLLYAAQCIYILFGSVKDFREGPALLISPLSAVGLFFPSSHMARQHGLH